MSIVFFGTPEFAVPSLKALIASGERISLVVTQTDKLKGRGHKMAPPPVKVAAVEAGLEVLQPAALCDERFQGELASTRPEFIVVVAYGKILPKSALDLPQRGCVNIHASLLPKYRGAAPIAWAILRGEEKTGITTMLMDEGLDTGPTLLRQEVEIAADDTAGTLGAKLSNIGASLLEETIRGMRAGLVKPSPQTGVATYAPPLKKEDGLIDWSKSAAEISCVVRAMQPWPSAYCYLNHERVMLLKAIPIEGNGMPRTIVRIKKDALVIGTGRGLLALKELQPSGKRPMPASAFILGRNLIEGTSLL
ncbi:MAG TPA: methionyl-tRNA formyltransferase [Thermodesulfovibrionales bacterium]|nr:methionyl-tRNA formyltransferase [Thermodesulfovibrionales bacterium]